LRTLLSTNSKWMLGAQIVRIVTGLLSVVLITTNVQPQQLSLWYAFGSLFGVFSLAELGISSILARHVAHWKGSDKLAEGLDQDVSVYWLAEKFYVVMAVSVFAVSFAVGIVWIRLKFPLLHGRVTYLCWLIYSAGGAAAIASLFYSAVINGNLEIWRNQRNIIISMSLNTLVLLGLYLHNTSLVVNVTAYFLSQSLFLILNISSYRTVQLSSGNLPIGPRKKSVLELMRHEKIRSIGRDLPKTVVGMLAFQAMTSAYSLIVYTYSPSLKSASYGLAMQFATIASSLAVAWSTPTFFEMASLRSSGKIELLKAKLWESLLKAGSFCLLGLSGIALLGPYVLHLIGSKTLLFETKTELVILLSTVFIEFIYGLLSQFLVSQGILRVTYYCFAGALGICAAGFALFLSGQTLANVLLSRFVVGLAIIGVPTAFQSWQLVFGKRALGGK